MTQLYSNLIMLGLVVFLNSCTNVKSKKIIEVSDLQEEVYTLFLGRIIKQEYIPDIRPSSCFKENVICTGVYIKYKIEVIDVLVGERINGIINAVRFQHGEILYKGSDLAVFVLSKITNPNSSKLLEASFFIEEYVKPVVKYCFNSSLEEYIPEIKKSVYSRCLTDSTILKDIKIETINNIIAKVKNKLKIKHIYIRLDSGYLKENKFINDDDLDDMDDCPYYSKFEDYAFDPNCDNPLNPTNVIKYTVKKGQAEKVKNWIQEEISKSRLGLDNIDIEYKIIEKESKSILEWHYHITPAKP